MSLGLHSTDLQRAKIIERSNYLRRKIEAWIEVQHMYIPALIIVRSRANVKGGGSLAAQDVKLYLPSEIPQSIPCDNDLVESEWELRYAMADVTLNALRSHLILHSRLYKSKDRHSRGQYQNTRSNDLIHTVERRIKASISKYRHIRDAMMALSKHRNMGNSDWETVYRVLHDNDVRGLTSIDNEGAEGHKSMSWIWKIYGTGETGVDQGTQDGTSLILFLSVYY